MERRHFLAKAAAGTAAVALTAACADKKSPTSTSDAAQVDSSGLPTLKWRCPSSFPKGTENIYSRGEAFANRVREATGGRFDIQLYGPGELVPAMGVLDATQQGTVECCHTCSYYFDDKDKAFVLGSTVPFSMNTRQFNAWWYVGGGRELLDEFYSTYHVKNFLLGNTTAQMGGWFKKEVRTMADFKGMRFRIAGIAVDILNKFGVTAMSTPGGDIAASMERGDLDAAEFVGPYEDEKLGLYKAAKFYYYPGWWEPNSNHQIFVNLDRWNKLPKEYQAIFEAAAGDVNGLEVAIYDANNPLALERMVKNEGVQLRSFSDEILQEAYTAARQIYAEESAKNPAFAKILESQDNFQKVANAWFALAEYRMDTFMQKVDAQR